MHNYINSRDILRISVLAILAFALLLGLTTESTFGQETDETDEYIEPVNDLQQPEYIWSVSWNPNGSSIALGIGPETCFQNNNDYSVRILNTETNLITDYFRYHNCSVTALDWSPDGSKIVTTAGIEGGAIVWDGSSQQPLSYFRSTTMPGFIDNIWNPNPANNYIASISEADSNITIWNPANGNVISSFNANSPTAITWSPDGISLATGNNEGSINIWNPSTGQSVTTISANPYAITAISWSPDGSQVASASVDNTVKLWDAVSGQNLLTLQGHTTLITEVNWSPDSTRLATASNDGSVRIWDTSIGTELEVFQYPGRVYSVDWNPVGTHIAFGGSRNDGQDAATEIEFVGLTESFSLLGSDNTVIANTLADDAELELSALPASVKFRSNTNPETVGSVRFVLDSGTPIDDNTEPYELENWSPTVGSHTLVATPYSGAGGTGTAGTPLTINFDVISSAAISSVSLVNPSTGTGIVDFDPLENNDVIDLTTMTISPVHFIAAPTVSTVGSVKFVLDSGTPYNDNTEPYQLENWIPTAGSHTLTVTPYSGANGTGTAGTALTINFTVVNPRILFDHNDNIYSINPDGSDRQNLGAGYAPAWSPDGTRIAFHAYGSGGREIYIMDADGSNRIRLTTNNIDDRNPAWSPDGTRIVYASVITGADWEIWVMDADGTGKIQITNNTIDDKDPQWSTTDWIAFTSNPSGYAQIFKMQPDGSQRTRLINSTVSTTSPEWSPDGSFIVYTRIGGTYTDIYRINADGTNALRLTNDPAVDQDACFSPDGSLILFSSLRNPGGFNYFELYTMNIDGSNETRLTATGSWDESSCAWGYP